MTGMALLLLAASVGYAAARALRVPTIPLLVLAGFAVALIGPVEREFLEDALILGVTFLVFAAGIELNPQRVRQQRRAALLVGVGQFVILGGVGFGVALALGFGPQTAAYLALALTASSTLVVVRVLRQRQQVFEPFGRLVIGVLLLQDLLVILLIPVVTRLDEGWGAVLQGVAATLALMALAAVLLRWVLPGLLRRLALDEELLLLVVLALLFTFLFLAGALGVPLVGGAFLAGVALSSFPLNGVVRGQLAPIGDFFTAIFFTALGASLGIPTWEEVGQALVLGGVVLVLTPFLVAWMAEWAGFSARPAILSGLLLAQTSEFSLVVGIQGVVLGQLAPGTFTVIALTTLATMMATPFLATDRVSLGLLHLHPARLRPRAGAVLQRLPAGRERAEAGLGADERPTGHVLLLGAGSSGMPLLETLVIGPYSLLVVDDDPRIVEQLLDSGIDAMRGDAADAEVLRRAGADRARVVVSTVRRVQDNDVLLQAAAGTPVLIRTFSEVDAEWVRARGGTPVPYPGAAAEAFLDWFDRNPLRVADPLEEVEAEEVL